jgi:hypothetical protein
VAYVLLVGRLEQEALALIAAGATLDGTPLTVARAREQFEVDINAGPQEIDSDRLELMQALGVA